MKGLIERGLVRSGIARVARTTVGDRALVLAYHNVVPDGERVAGERSLHVTQQRFAAQLDAIVRAFRIVPLDDLLSGRAPRGNRIRLALTFDDAYAGAVTAGVAELAKRGLPATIFIAPAFLGGGRFWWDVLAEAGHGELPADLRTAALTEHCGDTARVLSALSDGAGPDLPRHARCASLEQLRRAADVPGISFGSHSWSHANLARLAADDLRVELHDSLAWVRANLAPAVAHLSLPYGLGSPLVDEAAAAAGYSSALYIEGGWVDVPARRFAVPRLNIAAGVSPAGLVLRCSFPFWRSG